MPKPRRSHRRNLGSVFAVSVITVLGTVTCCTLYVVGERDPSPWILAWIVTPAVLCLATLVGVRWPKPGTALEFWHAIARSRMEGDRTVDYQPRRIDPQPIGTPGEQQPITADEVREIQLLSSNTWVPSQTRKESADDFLE